MSKDFVGEIQHVAEQAARYASEKERVFAARWDGRPDSTSIADAGSETRAALSKDFDVLHEGLGRMCAAYLEMIQEDREEVRRLVGDHPALLTQLFNHLGWQSRRIKSKADQKLALVGLAAISIGDLRGVDTRDLLIALGQVYVHLHRAGVFLSIALVRIAEISNPLPRAPQTTSARDFLLNFEESAYFKNSVDPKLKEVK